jgi:hypothetical protein
MVSQEEQAEEIPVVMVLMGFLGCQVDMENNGHFTEMLPYSEEIWDNAYNPVFENPKTMTLRVSNRELGFVLL